MSNSVEVTASIKADPKLLATLFWEMDSVQQAEFFSELYELTSAGSSYGLGEMQWLYMGKEIDKDPKAKAQACAMLAWVFNRATDFLERRI